MDGYAIDTLRITITPRTDAMGDHAFMDVDPMMYEEGGVTVEAENLAILDSDIDMNGIPPDDVLTVGEQSEDREPLQAQGTKQTRERSNDGTGINVGRFATWALRPACGS